jgi:PEP-CTERM motif
MRKLLLATTAIAAVALAPAANATLVEVSINGGSFTNICTAAPGSPCGNTDITIGGIDFTVTGMTTNSPGTASLADILSASVSILNTNAGTTTISLLASDTGFSAPSAPATLASEIGGSVLIGGSANTLSFLSCVDGTNALASCPGTGATSPVTANITALTSSYNANDSVLVTSLGHPFSMTEELNLALSGGAQINFSASSDLTPVPEPATLGLLGVGLLGLGFVANRKRSV